jgi:signal transduction histidine kinase
LHDTQNHSYCIRIADQSELTSGGYSFTVYPSQDLYKRFITANPANACAQVVGLSALSALLVLVYSYVLQRHQTALVYVAARDAALESKKQFVRYISHEIRTPLNAVNMGIQTIERNLRKSSDVIDTITAALSLAQQKVHNRSTKVNLESLADTRSAFDSALIILNDLLNYDKLESGTFQIEQEDVAALRYLQRGLKQQLVLLQTRDLTATLKFDVVVADGGHAEDGLKYLDPNDSLYIDTHKVDQARP